MTKRKRSQRNASGLASSGLSTLLLVVGIVALVFGVGIGARALRDAADPRSPARTASSSPASGAVPYPDVQRLSATETWALAQSGEATLYDTRSETWYARAHPEGALSLPEEVAPERLDTLPGEGTLIFICT